MIRKPSGPLILLNLAIVLAGFVILAYAGWFNRGWSDDWCFDTDFKHMGIVRTIGTYFSTGDEAQRVYPPNRY